MHYRTTGTEIVEQVPNVDVFVAGIGTVVLSQALQDD